MIYILTQAAKYIMLSFLLLYTISAYYVFLTDRQHSVFHYRMNLFFSFIILAAGYFSVYIHTNQVMVLALFGAECLFLIFYFLIFRLIYKQTNLLLWNHVILLLCIGSVMLARLNMNKAMKQFMIMAAAAVAALIIPKIMQKLKVTKIMAVIFGILGFLLLGAVLVLGKTSYGANLSLGYKGFSIQPSEFVKLTYVFLLAMIFRKSNSFKQVVLAGLVAAAHTGVLVLSKDLGGGFIYFLTFLAMVYTATHKTRYPLLGLVCLGGGACGAYALFSHVRVRVTAWQDPFSVVENQGYQIAQSLFSIGNGGFFGSGIGEGKPGYIPVVEKDFIFSAIAEECGSIFCILLILVCLNLFLTMLKIAYSNEVVFYKLIGVGLAAIYGVQTFLTIGGDIKLIPSTGVTLPLVSYGGSSLMSMFFILGIIQGLQVKNIKIEQAKELEQKIREGTTETRSVKKDGTLVIRKRIRKPNKKQQRFLDENSTENIPVTKDNTEIWVLGVIFTLFFVSAIGYLTYFNLTVGDEILNHPYNLARVKSNSEKIVRGSILSQDGVTLAYTDTDENGNEVRKYPFDNLFSHVVGYTGNSSAGIENLANTILLNSSATLAQQTYAELKHQKLKGDNVTTTIISSLQYEAYTAMGDNNGAVVVMEADTGNILAMVSKPDYNPNEMEQIWANISYMDAGESFLVNRACQGIYPPGSTFKILTALAYMRKYPDYAERFQYDCQGELVYGNTVLECSEHHAHGLVDIKKALCESCNGAFATIGIELTNKELLDIANQFYFGSELPIALRYKKSTFGLSEDSTAENRMMAAIGQGSTVESPIHNAMITASIANNGVMMVPKFLNTVTSSDGRLIETFEPEELGRVMTESEASVLDEYLRAVVEEGTGFNAASDDYISAGKTGSAQYSSSKDKLHAWYTGYAYKEGGKKIVVSVILEGAGSGGWNAAPVAKKIFDKYFSLALSE